MQTSILSAEEIRALCQSDKPMISPFSETKRWNPKGGKGVSGGLTYNGYDIHFGYQWSYIKPPSLKDRLLTKLGRCKPFSIDTARLDLLQYETVTAARFTIPPHSGVLCVTRERFDMPADVTGIWAGKSTYARIFMIVPISPLEPGWSGYLTGEIVNPNPYPMTVYAEQPLGQIMFHRVQPSSGYDGAYSDQAARPVGPLQNTEVDQ